MSAEYLSKKDLTAYLRISKGTIERMMKRGLPFVKLARRVLFLRSDIDAFMESKKIIRVHEKSKKVSGKPLK
jgi:excisionase family DNA binding protein